MRTLTEINFSLFNGLYQKEPLCLPTHKQSRKHRGLFDQPYITKHDFKTANSVSLESKDKRKVTNKQYKVIDRKNAHTKVESGGWVWKKKKKSGTIHSI